MEPWSPRLLSGVKYTTAGLVLLFLSQELTGASAEQILSSVRSFSLFLALLTSLFFLIVSIVGPIFFIYWLYKIGTRHKK